MKLWFLIYLGGVWATGLTSKTSWHIWTQSFNQTLLFSKGWNLVRCILGRPHLLLADQFLPLVNLAMEERSEASLTLLKYRANRSSRLNLPWIIIPIQSQSSKQLLLLISSLVSSKFLLLSNTLLKCLRNLVNLILNPSHSSHRKIQRQRNRLTLTIRKRLWLTRLTLLVLILSWTVRRIWIKWLISKWN